MGHLSGKAGQMTPTIHLISTVISIIATFGAFAVWILRYLDRHLDRRFAEVQRQFAEAKADTQRQFDELRAEMWRGFEQAREDRLRLEKKMEDKFELHGEQIARSPPGRRPAAGDRRKDPPAEALHRIVRAIGAEHRR